MLRRDFPEVADKWCPAGKGEGLDVMDLATVGSVQWTCIT